MLVDLYRASEFPLPRRLLSIVPGLMFAETLGLCDAVQQIKAISELPDADRDQAALDVMDRLEAKRERMRRYQAEGNEGALMNEAWT